MMLRTKTPAEAREAISPTRKAGRSIALVPTMGALHEGHKSLIRMARKRAGFVVSSIFVNPEQFGPGEDFSIYPRTPEDDCAALEKLGCDMVFIPEVEDIYGDKAKIGFSVDEMGDGLCGASRKGHFEGVLLIVAKLFNIIRPDLAYFGQKDAQQAVIIQRMVHDLDFPLRVVIAPTVRERDGLAMSSRNSYLSVDDRVGAAFMYRGLREAFEAAQLGERDPGVLTSIVRGRMEEGGFDTEYVEIVDCRTLLPVKEIVGDMLMAAAGRLSSTRLIDNIAMRVKGDSVEEILVEFPDWSFNEPQ